MSHRRMAREAVEERRRRARALLEREPDLSTEAVRTRTGVCVDTVRKLRAEVRSARCTTTSERRNE